MTQSRISLHRRRIKPAVISLLLVACLASSGCVYRMDIQQGNALEEQDIELVSVGMSRSQVQFLLGTPMVADPFHAQRWDYPYYLRRGRSDDVEQSWVAVHFEDGIVTQVERDLTLRPAS